MEQNSPADRIKLVIDRIEDNLDGVIDYAELADIMRLSQYEFRRMFSYMCGVGPAEYIRRRRLTKAAYDLSSSNESITATAARYGYDSPSSFSRAFKEQHGISPAEVKNGACILSAYPRLEFKFTLSASDPVSYRICHMNGFWLYGYMAGSHTTESGCCEDVWDDFFDKGYDGRVSYAPPFYQAAGYLNPTDGTADVICIIGAAAKKETDVPEDMDRLYIPEHDWGVFKAAGLSGTLINRAYDTVLNKWLPDSPYKRDLNVMNIECFSPETPDDEDSAEWEIWLPIERK